MKSNAWGTEIRNTLTTKLEDSIRLHLYDEQLRTTGSVTLTEENARAYMESRELKVTIDPQHPGLVMLSRQERLTLS